MVQKIVLTGGTYAGKTSLLKLFEETGYIVVPDIGLKVLADLNDELGQEGQRQYRNEKPVKFYERIINEQLNRESTVVNGQLILDRGVYDYIAMMKLKHVTIPPTFYSLISKTKYDKVFLLDTLSNFSQRIVSGRSLTKADSTQLNKLVREIYASLGCDVIEVREMPLQERYKFIKKLI